MDLKLPSRCLTSTRPSNSVRPRLNRTSELGVPGHQSVNTLVIIFFWNKYLSTAVYTCFKKSTKSKFTWLIVEKCFGLSWETFELTSWNCGWDWWSWRLGLHHRWRLWLWEFRYKTLHPNIIPPVGFNENQVSKVVSVLPPSMVLIIPW